MDLYRMEICSLFEKASTCFYLQIKNQVKRLYSSGVSRVIAPFRPCKLLPNGESFDPAYKP